MDKAMTLRNVRRLGVTVAALAVTVGGICLMRTVARRLAEGAFAETGVAARPAEPDRVPAARVYDLEKLVPETLRANLGGMSMTSVSKRMPMPLELALKRSRSEALAAGWEEMAVPLAYHFALLAPFATVYVTPDRRIVRRSHTALMGDETLREDLVIPAGSYLEVRRDMTLDEIVALHGEAVSRQIPEALAVVRVVHPLFTQLTRRGGGSALMVVGLSPLPADATAAQVSAAFVRGGWTAEPERANGWTKANLSATVNVSPRDPDRLADGSTAVFRIADDEVISTRKETQDE